MNGDPSEILADYKRSAANLRYYKSKEYPVGTKVFVNCSKYVGDGIVAADSSCPIDKVAVRLGNDNVWFYGIENVRRTA